MSREILNHLINQHRNIEGLLRILERQLASIRSGDRPDYFLMNDIIRYLTYYPDHYHHPFEDMIYACLAEKHPEYSAIVADVEGQHGRIDLRGNVLRESIDGIIRGSVISRDQIYNDGMDYIELYREHMQTEEDDLFDALSINLEPADWTALTESFQWLPDPISADEVQREYIYLKECITREGAGTWPWKECLTGSCPVCSSIEETAN